jgi:hypothetical protein
MIPTAAAAVSSILYTLSLYMLELETMLQTYLAKCIREQKFVMERVLRFWFCIKHHNIGVNSENCV